MNCKPFLILGLLFSFLNVVAQDIKLSIQTGYGFYNMSSLSRITEGVLGELPFEAKIVSNYPPYLYYQPMIKISESNFELSFIYTFQTTGSRISYKDYSGEYRFDSKINCKSPGISIHGIAKDYGKFKVGLMFQVGANFSVLKMDEFLRIDATVERTGLKFESNSFYIEPGINVIYPWNRMCFELNLGYYKELFRQDYSLSGESQNFIPVREDYRDSDIWDGVRVGVTYSFTIFKSKNSENSSNE